jgi:hypothetical protein
MEQLVAAFHHPHLEFGSGPAGERGHHHRVAGGAPRTHRSYSTRQTSISVFPKPGLARICRTRPSSHSRRGSAPTSSTRLNLHLLGIEQEDEEPHVTDRGEAGILARWKAQ